MYGRDTPFCIAKNNGTANSGMINTLLPDTTYYIRIDGGSETDYLFTLSAPSLASVSTNNDPNNVESNIATSPLQDTSIIAGSSQSAALNIPLDTTVYSTIKGKSVFLSFTTTEEMNATYYITTVNSTVDSKRIYVWLLDAYGNAMDPTERDNDYLWQMRLSSSTKMLQKQPLLL